MKTLLIATSLLTALTFASGSPMPPQEGTRDIREDSARLGMEPHRDSLRLPVLPDSLRTVVEQRAREFDAKKTEFSRDSVERSDLKVSVDSLRKIWEAKRDTQVANIKDTLVRAKVEARIEKVSEHKTAVKAKVDARKARIEARKSETPVAPTTP